MSENALPPDEREAFDAWFLDWRSAGNAYTRYEEELLWLAWQARARLAVQGGDAGQTDVLGATPAGSGSAASRPEPQCVSALRTPIPRAEDGA